MNPDDVSYSILELAIVSQDQSFQQALHNARILAKAAEEYGYRRIWFAEHHNAAHIASVATSLLIGYVAENTSTIRVGSGGVMLPNHSPLIIAEQFGTLAHLYPGRIDLGLGRAPGTDQQTAMAIRPDFFQGAQRFPQEIDQIQRYFSRDNNRSPVRAAIAEGAEVPLYILGSSTDSAHLAASKGLPYAFASHFATTHLFDALRIYHQNFQASPYLDQPYTMAGINVFIAKTEDEAERLFSSLVRMFVSFLTRDEKPLQPPVELSEDLRQALEHPTIRQMLNYSFYGTKETVKAKVKEFLDQTRVNELIAVSPIYDLDDRLRSVRMFSEVMQEINREK